MSMWFLFLLHDIILIIGWELMRSGAREEHEKKEAAINDDSV